MTGARTAGWAVELSRDQGPPPLTEGQWPAPPEACGNVRQLRGPPRE